MLASPECRFYFFAGYSAAACVESVGGQHTRDEELMMMTLMMTMMMTNMCNGDDDDDDQHVTVMYAIRMLECICIDVLALVPALTTGTPWRTMMLERRREGRMDLLGS
jgi:hypothetical protein